jgi:hypothetical protein
MFEREELDMLRGGVHTETKRELFARVVGRGGKGHGSG